MGRRLTKRDVVTAEQVAGSLRAWAWANPRAIGASSKDISVDPLWAEGDDCWRFVIRSADGDFDVAVRVRD